MSWLRLDDGFSRHPKVTSLTLKDRWTWVDLLCYCARYRTDGYVPENIREHISGATDKFLHDCHELRLLDNTQHGLRIHDWEEYQPKDPTGADRQAKWRKAQRNGPRNGGVTENVTVLTVTDPLPRAQARARDTSRPVPSHPNPPPAQVNEFVRENGRDRADKKETAA